MLKLDWRPLARDSVFYSISIICLIIFSWDGYYEHYEAVALVLFYVAYIMTMAYNKHLMKFMSSWVPS